MIKKLNTIPKLKMIDPLKTPSKEKIINDIFVIFEKQSLNNVWKIADIVELKLMEDNKLFVEKNNIAIQVSKMNKTQLENLFSFLVMANNQIVSSKELIKWFIPLCDFPGVGRSYHYAIKRLEKLNYLIWEETSASNNVICYGVDLKGNSFMLNEGKLFLFKCFDDNQVLSNEVVKNAIAILKAFHRYSPFI